MAQLSFATDFATHRHLLATDDDYRRRHGLGPLTDDERPAAADDNGTTVLGVDAALVRKLDALKQERRECDARSKRLKAQIEEIEEILVEQFGAAEVRDLTLNNRRASLSSLLWLEKVDEETPTAAIIDALKADDLGHYVTVGYNYQSLTAYARELEEQNKPLPPHLSTVLRGRVDWRIGFTQVRRTATSRRRAGDRGSAINNGASSN